MQAHDVSLRVMQNQGDIGKLDHTGESLGKVMKKLVEIVV
jgi:hypothetical protein